jgi:hypothetical protein
MAFSDFPFIDNASLNNELSERKLKEQLNKTTGFILRPDVPDIGCDFDAELILERDKGSNWRIPIQLKSIENLTLVENNKFISYQFETSRLGYLMRRLPGMGIIVLYSVQEDKCFYDYCDKVYMRLMEDRNSDDWKENDKVNIRIPYKNKLDPHTVSEIHNVFKHRFEQAAIMQSSHGNKYDLPSLNMSSEFKYDFHNLEHVKKLIKEYGMIFLSRYDLKMIFTLIVTVPHVQIYEDKELLKVASISYSETGHFVDSNLFIQKLLRRTDLTDDETELIHFAKLKNNIGLGLITSDEYIAEANKLKDRVRDIQNKICVEINITFYELLKIKTLHSIPERLIRSIESVFDQIKKLDAENHTKYLFQLWNIENYSLLVNNFQVKEFSEQKIRESMGFELTLEEKKQKIIFLMSLQNKILVFIDTLNKAATDTNNSFLKASVFALNSRRIIAQEIAYISLNVALKDRSSKHQELFLNHIDIALQAYSMFLDLSYYREAYNSLCNAIELIEVSRNYYNYCDTKDLSRLLQIKSEMEDAIEIEPYNLILPDLISRQVASFQPNDNDMSFLTKLDDEEIEKLAKITQNSLKLPSEQLINYYQRNEVISVILHSLYRQ